LPGGPMTCTACGRALPPGVSHCPACGTPIPPPPPTQRVEWASPGGQPQQYAPQPTPFSAQPFGVAPTFPYAPRPQVRPIRGLTVGLIVTLGLWALLNVGTIVANVLGVITFGRALEDESVVIRGDADLSTFLTLVVFMIQYAVFLAAGIVFIVWLFRARANAEALMSFRHRLSRPWLVLGWIVPVVSFWFPYQLVSDVWRTSDPRRTGRASGLVLGWWLLFLLYELAWGFPVGVLIDTVDPADAQLASAANVLLALVGFVAAGLAVSVTWRIASMQESQRVRAF
jgi:hypothetical protein